ncbi:hybrid sensor histidine kinase/response regulator transcription factor [Rufibacter latericius]|uniref:hybrid sensor histidine kinase/response regulator transcription factor n=1 Tax=Rufibacter latericius TaxID=2487040 RepID=UPI000F62AE20|nr:two-component regulator propeller domain-containing protein [Rufibacter latericius]
MPNQPRNIIRQFGVEEGLSLGIVTSISQDQRGLMWFATEDGLNRFDGYSFKVFKYDPARKNSLTGNFIRKVFTDSRGMVWVSSRHGLNRFNAKGEAFVHYSYNPASKNSLAGDDISDISESKAGNLWVASYRAGVSFYHRDKNQFTAYRRKDLPGLPSDKILSLYEDSKGWLWVGTQDAGVHVYKVKEGVVLGKVPFPGGEGLAGASVSCIYEDRSGLMWLGSSRGLYLYARGKQHLFTFPGKEYFRNSNIVLSVLEDSKGMLWVGLQDGGAYQLDLRQLKRNGPEKVFFTEVQGKDGRPLTQRSVQALFEDKDQNLWVGTYGEGIKMVAKENEKFIKFRISQDVLAKQAPNEIRYYGICTDKEGNLWLGTDGNGIYKCDKTGKVLNHYATSQPEKGLTDNAILSALRDSRQNLWFGSYAKGLFLYKKETDSFQNFQHDPANSRTLGGNDVRALFEDSKKNLWVGTNGGGLSLLQAQTQSFQTFNTANSGISSNDVRALAEDKAGRLWIGTYGGGLSCYSPDTKSFKKYPYAIGKDRNPSSEVVLALFVDQKQNLWIGTEEDGLFRYNLSTRKIQQYREKDGLANNTVYAIQADVMGHVWVSTNRGLTKIDTQTGKLYNYGLADGLQSGKFNPGSVLVNKAEGLLGFGGTKGLNLFYPGQIKETVSSPEVLITGLQLFNKPGSPQGQEQLIEENQTLVLRPDQSVFMIEFGALDYAHPAKNNYAYKLEGFDKEWNYVGQQRSATYRYLSPGTYTFKVKASNQENAWDDEFTSLKVVVSPPFWRTVWAYCLYVILIIGSVFGVYNFVARQRKLRRKLMVAKAQSRKERRIARERLSFFTEVSHEFRTPLTLMLGPLEDLVNKETGSESGKKLKMVYRNAHKLLALINKLLDYRKAEAGSLVLKVQEEDIVSFVKETYISFQDLALKKQINYQLEVPDAPVLAWFDREKLEMVLSNLLSNAFKYLGQGNSITVALTVENSALGHGFAKVEVKDNGRGVPVNQQKHIFDWFFQGDPVTPMSSGLGLALAKRLVLLHKGDIYVQSEEGAGATFGFNIPLGREHIDASSIVSPEPTPLLPDIQPEVPSFQDVLGPDSGNHPKKGQRKLLIVEDEEDIRKLLKYYLSEQFHILEAENGKEGLELALAHHPNLIISDVKMPVMDGIELCRELKSNIKTSHIPVVLLTARTAFAHHKEGLDTGADAYLTKPFSPELLQIKIKNLLESQEKLKKFYLNLFNINSPQPEKETSSLDEQFLKRIYEILKENLDNSEFNVNDLSAALNMSRSLAYKKIKLLTGASPVEYLRTLRLQESARLLKTGKYKVFEVAYQVGFNDDKYFRQCFSKEFGCTPSEFVKTADIY